MNLRLDNDMDEVRIAHSEMSVFLRRILQWDPPPAFSTWLYEKTAGQIISIQRALVVLLQQDVIQFQDSHWLVADHYTSIPTEVLLQQHTMTLNLPWPRNKFVGRVQLRQQITTTLAQERLLTLIGTGGVGKTRLALQIGYDNLAAFQHGVCFVALSGVETPGSLAAAIVQALRTSTYGQGMLDDQLINYLRNKNLLLILDNYEHLLPETNLIKNILDNAPGIRMLVTSRERLNLYQEAVITVPVFSVPQRLDDFEASEAAQFFLQRARKVLQSFILKEPDVQYVHRIYHLVGGLPLGIE